MKRYPGWFHPSETFSFVCHVRRKVFNEQHKLGADIFYKSKLTWTLVIKFPDTSEIAIYLCQYGPSTQSVQYPEGSLPEESKKILIIDFWGKKAGFDKRSIFFDNLFLTILA